MLFYNTNDKNERVTFREALLRGQAPNYGLYTIDRKLIPQIPMRQLLNMAEKPYWQIAHEVLLPYLGEEITANDLLGMVKDAYDEKAIPVTLENVVGKTYVLKLYGGPTSSFKDFAARFFAHALNYFAGKYGLKFIVVVATSGDTGPAIADAFWGLENVVVVVLYPGKNIYPNQRKQISTLHKNVFAVEVESADFNLCQDMAIRLMNDKKFAKEVFANENVFTSANSISLGRLLPQIVFPFYAYSRLPNIDSDIVVCVPSGNFGDVTGTFIAKKMGLPIKKIVVAVNENDEFVRFLKAGRYEIRATRQTPSSAMDVNNPNNLPRLFDLYGGQMINLPEKKGWIKKMPDLNRLRIDATAYSVNNQQTMEAIKTVLKKHEILLDPHGAVGWHALQTYLGRKNNRPAVFWQTADPSKFQDVIEQATGLRPPLTYGMAKQADLPERIFKINQPAKLTPGGGMAHSDGQYQELLKIVAGNIHF